jgi:hypothetical protein
VNEQVDDASNWAIFDQNIVQIQHQRKRARESMVNQAERMVKRSRIVNVAGNPGDNVTVPIPLVDRGKYHGNYY